MAKPEYFYGVHSVESLLELEPERVLTLFALKGRDDQRLKRIFDLAEPFGVSIQKASRDSLEKLAGQKKEKPAKESQRRAELGLPVPW